jgi:hypothetical protein
VATDEDFFVTREKALELADDQRRELEARGATNIDCRVVEFSPGDWGVDGRYDLDVSTDPVWGPVVAALNGDGETGS